MRKRWKERAASKVSQSVVANNEEASDLGSPIAKSECASLPSLMVGDDYGGVISSDDGEVMASGSKKKQRVEVVDVAEDSVASSSTSRPTKTATPNPLFGAAVKNTELKQFAFPWEKGPLAKIFGSKTDNLVTIPKLQPGVNNAVNLELLVAAEAKVEPRLSSSSMLLTGAIYETVVKQTDRDDFATQRFQQKQLSLRSWWKLLASNISASEFGRKVLAEADRESVNSCAIEILDATFAVKSPNTLMKRFYALKGYFDFCETVELCEWAPLTEQLAWKYAKYLRDSDAAATKIGSFIEAARFAWYMLGLGGANLVESSLRVKGLSAQMRVKKKPWRPASLLTIAEVKQLHAGLEDERLDPVDRIFCGHMLHLLYSRSRWSDLLAVVEAFMDEDHAFFELNTQQHKGAKSAENKAKLLPIVAPCIGITGSDWVEPYMKLRANAGLALPAEQPLAMLPAPQGSGGTLWRKRHLTTEEGADFLRIFLKAPKTSSRRVSTHSMKATAISWCAKAGLSEESRALLARHASAVKNPVALYSRDLLSSVLREFCIVLEQIASKSFEPDRSRSGMITPGGTSMRNPATPTFVQPVESMLAATPKAKAKSVDLDVGCASPSLLEEAELLGSPKDSAPSIGDEAMDELEQDALLKDPSERATAASRFMQRLAGDPELEDVNMSEIFTDSSEDLSEESSSCDEEEVDLEIERSRNLLLPRLESASGLFINSKSSVVHCKKTATAFVCGRKISDSYVPTLEPMGFRCGRCFNI